MKKGFIPIAVLVLFLFALAAGGSVFVDAAKKDKNRQVSLSTVCAVNFNSKDCQGRLPQKLKVSDLPKKCADSNYEAELKWKNKGPDWFVDVTVDSSFSSFASKHIPDRESVKVPEGFNQNLTLEPGKIYYWRVYYGVAGRWVDGPSFSVPVCGKQVVPTPSPTPAKSSPSPTPSSSVPYLTPYLTPGVDYRIQW